MTTGGSDNILKWIAIVSIGVVVLFVGWFVYNESTKSGAQPKSDAKIASTAKKIADLGRTHVEVGEKVKYNSNPPTSGPHYADWKKNDIYTDPQQDEYLVHSLEHGYVIMSYNCDAKLKDGSKIDCDTLKKQLGDLFKEKGAQKLIVVPRPSLDVPLALTAWTYIDKMDRFEKDRIVAFIDAFRDKGPEQTME